MSHDNDDMNNPPQTDHDRTVPGLDAESLGLPKKIGDYEIHERIGRGGMSHVYRATCSVDKTPVALKVMDGRFADQPAMQERFRREAKAIQALHHDHIVPLHGYGDDDGTLYLAMKLIQGITVTDLIEHLRRQRNQEIAAAGGTPSSEIVGESTRPTPEAEIAACASKVLTSDSTFHDIAKLTAVAAEAVGGAHTQGIIHRDIKPSNLMIDREGELWLTDFGLAANDDGQTIVTQTGELIGTPHYMSPEQASADHHGHDFRTDIYSLGATLYELTSLTRPFSGDRMRVLMEITTGRLTPPTKHRDDIPRSLEAIILKAMAYAPSDRYQSASDLADDLGRFIRGESTTAKSPTWIDHAGRWIARNPRTAFGSVLGAAILAGLIITLQFLHSRQLGVTQNKLQDTLYVADVSGAFRAYGDRDIDTADQLLDRHIPGQTDVNTSVDRRGFEWRLLKHLIRPPKSFLLGKHPGNEQGIERCKVAILPGTDDCLSVGYDGQLRRWCLKDHKPINAIEIGPPLEGIAVSSNGEEFVTSELFEEHNNPVTLRSVETGGFIRSLPPHANTMESACYSPDGKYIATADRYNEVVLHPTDGSPPIRKQIGSRAESLAFTPGGKHLLALVRDKFYTVQKLAIPSLKTEGRWTCDLAPEIFALSGDGERLLVGDRDELALYSWPEMELLTRGRGLRGRLRCIALNNKGTHIYAGCDNGSLLVWDVSALDFSAKFPKPETMISTGNRGIISLVLTRDERVVVTTAGGEVQEWHANNRKESPLKLDKAVKSVAPIPREAEGAFVRFANGDVGKIDFATREFQTLSIVAPDKHFQLAVSPDQSLVAASTPDQIVVIDAATGEHIQRLEKNIENDPSDGLAFSKDNQTLFHLLNDHFQVYSVGKKAEDCAYRKSVPLGDDGVNGLTVSPRTGELIVSVTALSKLLRFPAPTFELRAESVACDHGNFTSFCYSENGDIIALGYGDGTVEIRNADFEELTQLKGHRSQVNHCLFIDDDKKLITCSDRQIRFSDIASERELGVLDITNDLGQIHYCESQDCLFAFPLYDHPVEVWTTGD